MPRPARVVDQPTRHRPPALNPEDREDQLIAMAYDLAEEQIRDKTVSAQVLAHFVKQGSPSARLEKERLIQENLLLRARTEAIQSAGSMEELYKKAIGAMKSYGGNPKEDVEDDEE